MVRFKLPSKYRRNNMVDMKDADFWRRADLWVKTLPDVRRKVRTKLFKLAAQVGANNVEVEKWQKALVDLQQLEYEICSITQTKLGNLTTFLAALDKADLIAAELAKDGGS